MTSHSGHANIGSTLTVGQADALDAIRAIARDAVRRRFGIEPKAELSTDWQARKAARQQAPQSTCQAAVAENRARRDAATKPVIQAKRRDALIRAITRKVLAQLRFKLDVQRAATEAAAKMLATATARPRRRQGVGTYQTIAHPDHPANRRRNLREMVHTR